MKHILLFSLLFTVIIFIGCSKTGVNDPEKIETNSGKMLLKFNKTETPENVALITATLSRSGYQNITGNLNILTDTSADLSMSNIPVGMWHLKIEAKNNAGDVLYKGETDVNIVASIITQVSITLTPVAGNTGSIYISVAWGSRTESWLDYYKNPFLIGTNSSFDANGVRRPYVVVDGNISRMWFANTNAGNISSVGYAISNDGLTWQRGSYQPVMGIGSPGKWDDGSMTVGPVIKVDGEFRMYYSGRSPIYGTIHIGLAISNDGLNWTKQPNPVLYAQTGWEQNIDPGDVIKINNTYYLYYSGISSQGVKIGLAMSQDGINWTRYSGNPILSASQPWESGGIYIPSVVKTGDKYYMVYQNYNSPGAFGMATSLDGINWTKNQNNPIFERKDISQSWASEIMYPCLRIINNEWRLYYSGPGTGLGVARKAY